MHIYTGKNADSDSSAGLCTRVVLDLMSGLEKDGYNLYTDNYYTSPLLYTSLYKKGVNACGTMHANRKGLPPDLIHKRKDETRGFYDFRSSGPLLEAMTVVCQEVHILLVNNPSSLMYYTYHCKATKPRRNTG